MRAISVFVIALMLGACSLSYRGAVSYQNPVIDRDAPDPTLIRGEDGLYYAYTTMRGGNVPIYRSADLVEWEHIGGAFNTNEVPHYVPKAGIWAPDISRVGDNYVLYFSMSTWGGEWEAGIGRAVADNPAGPFTQSKFLFDSREIGVQNSIDPMLYQEDGRCYLVWGSFRGIYLAELTDDGLELKEDVPLRQIAGTAYEGSYILKREGWYYLFASVGTCCEGLNSTYQTVVGRSRSLFGPYVNRAGESMMENHHEVLLSGDDKVKGTGHDSQIVQDDAGEDWILYHGFDVTQAKAGRKSYLDRVWWDSEGWPHIGDGTPTREGIAPTIKKR